ncbi:MAG: hypothetical protein HY747_10945 [Elusimicrobia bacterium]|nr:hypothetical protein [Elusimicrobiota bacterium]
MLRIEKLVQQLYGHDVAFALIGGVAMAAQGSVYVTYDLDVCYERSDQNYERLIKALAPIHPILRGASENLPFQWDTATLKAGLNFTLRTDWGDLDLFGEVAGLGFYSDMAKYSEMMTIAGVNCRVLGLIGLIKAKEAASRPKDLIHLKELRALKALRESRTEQGPKQ